MRLVGLMHRHRCRGRHCHCCRCSRYHRHCHRRHRYRHHRRRLLSTARRTRPHQQISAGVLIFTFTFAVGVMFVLTFSLARSCVFGLRCGGGKLTRGLFGRRRQTNGGLPMCVDDWAYGKQLSDVCAAALTMGTTVAADDARANTMPAMDRRVMFHVKQSRDTGRAVTWNVPARLVAADWLRLFGR